MLNINLNLPTLPTQDQKDAMDGANTPDATNVFATMNDLTGGTLQDVTDLGNTTTNDVQLINDAEVIFGAGGGVLLDNGSRLREGTIDAGFGGSKGISQICAVGYELKWEAGRQYVMDGNGVLIRHSLNNFSTIPSATDDSTKGYYVGSLWTLDNGVSYICTDSTSGSATWDLYEAVPQVNADWNATSGVAEILNKPTIPSVTGFVPYTGANNDLDLGTYNLTADHITLNTNPSGAGFVEGSTQWNNTIGSSETTLKGGNVVLKNGVDLVARIVNKVTPSATLTKANYQAVKVSGATGGRLSVGLAQADVDLNSADTIGLVCETIATNQEGFILTVGQLLDINTTGSLQGETWSDGDVLYLSPTTAGKLTNIKPTGATGHIVVIGYVEYSHSVHGAIYVKIMNGWELDELHNVYINGVANNNLLAYESATSLWKNKTASALGIAELSSATFTGAVRVNDGTGSLIFRQATAIAADPCIFLFNNQVTAPSATNYILKVSSVNSGATMLNGNNGLIFTVNGTQRMSITNGTSSFTTIQTASSASTSFQFNPSSNTNQTASTEQKSFDIATCTSQHATGALTTQRFAVINAPTYSFVGASTITNAATLAITASPIAGTNATITNSYALWVQGGKSLFAGNIELTQTVTTESLTSNRSVTIVINGTTYKLLAAV